MPVVLEALSWQRCAEQSILPASRTTLQPTARQVNHMPTCKLTALTNKTLQITRIRAHRPSKNEPMVFAASVSARTLAMMPRCDLHVRRHASENAPQKAVSHRLRHLEENLASCSRYVSQCNIKNKTFRNVHTHIRVLIRFCRLLKHTQPAKRHCTSWLVG